MIAIDRNTHIGHTAAQAQGWGGAFSGFVNGYQQGAVQAQQLEALQLQNELLRLQIERARAEEQAREEAYARSRRRAAAGSSHPRFR